MSCKIIAHRGESYEAPENTLSSVNLAWERDADAAEIDVHLSKDNKVVVIHDSKTTRIGGRDKKIKNQTLNELKELDVGFWKNEKYEGEKIPAVSEILNTVPSDKFLVIEIKSDKKLLPYLKQDILHSGIDIKQIEIISFSYSTVIEAKKILPDANVLYLANLDYSWWTKITSLSVSKLITKTMDAGLDGINVWAGRILDRDYVKNVKKNGLSLYVWTVNDPQHAKELISWGVDGLTTDRAGWMKEQIYSK